MISFYHQGPNIPLHDRIFKIWFCAPNDQFSCGVPGLQRNFVEGSGRMWLLLLTRSVLDISCAFGSAKIVIMIVILIVILLIL